MKSAVAVALEASENSQSVGAGYVQSDFETLAGKYISMRDFPPVRNSDGVRNSDLGRHLDTDKIR